MLENIRAIVASLAFAGALATWAWAGQAPARTVTAEASTMCSCDRDVDRAAPRTKVAPDELASADRAALAADRCR